MPMVQVRSFILGYYPIRGFLAWAEGDREALCVYPAHGPATTVGAERRYNPFLR